jgi:hypothetical protein
MVIGEKEKEKKQIKRNSNKRSKAEKGKEQDLLKKTSLGQTTKASETCLLQVILLKQRAQTIKVYKSSP